MKLFPKSGPTPRQGFALRSLSLKIGEFISWEEIDKMTKKEATVKISEMIKKLEDK